MAEKNVKNENVKEEADILKEVKIIVDEETFTKIVKMTEEHGLEHLEFNIDTTTRELNFRPKTIGEVLRTEEDQKEKPADDEQKDESAKIKEVAPFMEMIVEVGEEPYANLLRMVKKWADITVATKIDMTNEELHVVIKANENSLINEKIIQKQTQKLDSKLRDYAC